ncbi:hypothetical protein BHE74_00029044 [Ensete ventricosum]|nr:hypothetical protein BHE74_00029044 [Ensete ventricosum]
MVWVIKQWGEVKTCVHHTGGAWGARGVLVAVGVAVPGVLPTIDVTPQPSPPSSSHRLFLFRSSLAVVNVVTSRDFARRILSWIKRRAVSLMVSRISISFPHVDLASAMVPSATIYFPRMGFDASKIAGPPVSSV